MARPLAVVGASSSIGIRPYDDGDLRQLSRAPEVLRERGLIQRLEATDFGDVAPPPYRDLVRPPSRARNEEALIVYSRSLAQRVAAATALGRFTLVLGGDCSVVLGCLIGAKRTARGQVGLVYVDAHADFATPEESRTGSVAGMSLALAELLAQDLDELAVTLLRRVTAGGLEGFWIQVDADVLNPAVMSAVDSPEPGGLMPGELVQLLTPLVRHPLALGLSLTTYDPAFDADRSGARQLVRLLETLLVSSRAVVQPAEDVRAIGSPT